MKEMRAGIVYDIRFFYWYYTQDTRIGQTICFRMGGGSGCIGRMVETTCHLMQNPLKICR
jgi:hypothetical protein